MCVYVRARAMSYRCHRPVAVDDFLGECLARLVERATSLPSLADRLPTLVANIAHTRSDVLHAALLQIYAVQLARRDVPTTAAARALLPFVRRVPFAADAPAVQRLVECFVVASLRTTPRSRTAAIDAVVAALSDVIATTTTTTTTTTSKTTTTDDGLSPDATVKKRRLAAELAICADSVRSPPRKTAVTTSMSTTTTTTTSTTILGSKRRLYDQGDDRATSTSTTTTSTTRRTDDDGAASSSSSSSSSVLAAVLETARAAATVGVNDTLSASHVLSLEVMARVAFALAFSARAPPGSVDAALGVVGLFARTAADIVVNARWHAAPTFGVALRRFVVRGRWLLRALYNARAETLRRTSTTLLVAPSSSSSVSSSLTAAGAGLATRTLGDAFTHLVAVRSRLRVCVCMYVYVDVHAGCVQRRSSNARVSADVVRRAASSSQHARSATEQRTRAQR